VQQDGEDSHEEYEWAGQTRVRPSSFLSSTSQSSGLYMDGRVSGRDRREYAPPSFFHLPLSHQVSTWMGGAVGGAD